MNKPIRKVKDYFCLKCGVSLRGAKVAKKSQHLYGVTHFGREIGNYSMKEDRTVSWSCPDCGHQWLKGRS